MSNIKREEEKYLVVKSTDLQGAGIVKRAAFFGALHGLNIPARQFLVIEADWPEYEPAWAMIQARVEGSPAVSDGRRAFDYHRGFTAGEAERETLRALSVTNILLDVVPGDGDGHEVYAKSVDDVVGALTEAWMLAEQRGDRIADLESLLQEAYVELCGRVGTLAGRIEDALKPAQGGGDGDGDVDGGALEESPEFVREFCDLSFSDQQELLTGKRPDPMRNY